MPRQQTTGRREKLGVVRKRNQGCAADEANDIAARSLLHRVFFARRTRKPDCVIPLRRKGDRQRPRVRVVHLLCFYKQTLRIAAIFRHLGGNS